MDTGRRDSLASALGSTRLAVAGIVALGLVLRLVGIGSRVAHFDEGRVAYWTLQYAETGAFRYRYIIHGPFVQHVDRAVFAVLGPSDASMRLVVAVVGAALPAAALLFRGRLRDSEVVGLAALLALNPVVLYYSRFFRSTLLVAGFSLIALGAGLRAYDSVRPGWLYVAAAFLAFAFAAKENAVVYILCWLGAGALLLDFSLLSPQSAATGAGAVRGRLRRLRARLGRPASRRRAVRWGGHVAGAVAVFGALSLFFYAPRDPGGLGLWSALGSGNVGPLLEATWADVERGLRYWFGGSTEPNCNEDDIIAGYLCFLGQFAETLGRYAPALMGFAVVGTIVERYATERPRPLVMFGAYWGFVSVLGYPLGTDIYGAWITVNALVPLAIPAAVGLALVARWGYEASVDGDSVSAGVAVAVLLLVVAQVGATTATTVYQEPTADDNGLVQFAQPQQDVRGSMDTLAAAAPEHDGVDLLLYGDELTVEPGTGGPPEPNCSKMVTTLPLQWYVQLYDASTVCANDRAALERELADAEPAMVMVHQPESAAVEQALGDGYVTRTHHLRTIGREVVVFVHRDYAADDRRQNATDGQRALSFGLPPVDAESTRPGSTTDGIALGSAPATGVRPA